MFGWYRSYREPLPLSARWGGEGGARRGCAGRVRWVVRLLVTGLPHLTPTLSAPKGGEGDIPAACLAVRSVHALARKRGSRVTAEVLGPWIPAFAE
jgi:hypothetical protein